MGTCISIGPRAQGPAPPTMLDNNIIWLLYAVPGGLTVCITNRPDRASVLSQQLRANPSNQKTVATLLFEFFVLIRSIYDMWGTGLIFDLPMLLLSVTSTSSLGGKESSALMLQIKKFYSREHGAVFRSLYIN